MGWQDIGQLKDVGQFTFWGASIIGITVAAWKGLTELRLSREQRDRELRWKKADAARSLIHDLFDDQQSQNAGFLLDYDGRTFDIGKKRVQITRKMVYHALRTEKTDDLDKIDLFVRDCFDNFFYFVDLMEHARQSGLVDLSDLRFPLDYYVAVCMNREPKVFTQYMTEYGYGRALTLLRDLGFKSG